MNSQLEFMGEIELSEVDIIKSSDLFNATWYCEKYFDLHGLEIDAALHYVMHGANEGRNPGPEFDTDFYLQANPDVAASGLNPLAHYILFGEAEGRSPTPPEVMSVPAQDGAITSLARTVESAIDVTINLPVVSNAGQLLHSDIELLESSDLMDPIWYRVTYPDLLEAPMSMARHYIEFGAQEGRNPGPNFDTIFYRNTNRDVAAADINPLVHYILHGQVEGRRPINLADRKTFNPMQGEKWPPAPLDDYFLPQTLRDYIIDSHGEAAVGLYWYLCSVMKRFESQPESFPESDVCSVILQRLKYLSRGAHLNRDYLPEVTVIIPVYNNILDTLICLVTVLEVRGEHKFEIIVADDCSCDATSDLVWKIGGVVRHFRQSDNLGFLENCNVVAQQGRGRYLVFLNNDTLVLPGWLDELLAPFDQLTEIGCVGSKLINWDGTLQEAGGVFWRDGSAWNFGRGQDATAPEFNYLKDVDYCSGASIAVPTDLWRKLGGFDPEFAPAYCEDSDLAFRVRREGLRTVYAPASSVVHHEGRSHGRDLNSGIKAYQVANQAKLFERWRDVLERDHFPNATEVLRARDRSGDARHVLFIDHYVPQWDQDAGSRTIYQYMRVYQELGCSITLWPDNLHYDKTYARKLQSQGIEVIYGPKYVNKFKQFWDERRGLYDTVFLSRPHVAEKYVPIIGKNENMRVLYYGHDLHFRRMEFEGALRGGVDAEAIARMKERELSVCRQCDVIFYPAQEEVDTIKKYLNGSQRVFTNPVFVYEDAALEDARRRIAEISARAPATLVFVGGFSHTPNVDGIVWFVREVLPLIHRAAPTARLVIAGSNPPAEVMALADHRVDVLGFVSDERLESLYAVAGVAVAPLRFGAGVKGKVIEALAKGVPVATTSVGAQGIENPQTLLFLGDTPEELADAVLQAFDDRREAKVRASSALAFISDRYSARALKRIFMDVSFAPRSVPVSWLEA